jgi:hypothetical protein
MTLSFYMSNSNSFLYPIILLFFYCLSIYKYVQRRYRVKSGRFSIMGTLVRILEQFLLKTKGVNSGHGNRNMIGKIPTWWENSVLRNRKTAGKNSSMVGDFPQWRKNVFLCMDHLLLRHPLYKPGFPYPFCISVYW